MKLFSLDSPVGRAIALLADLVILNLLFLFSCMPIITIGAACGALYDTVYAMLTGECGIIYQQYFSGLKKCFLKGTVLFLISLVVIMIVLLDLIFATHVEGLMGLLCTGVIGGSLLIALAVMAHLPMAVTRNPKEKVRHLLLDGLVLAMKNGWRSIAAMLLNAVPAALFLFAPELFLQTWMFWFLVGFAAVAYVNNWLLLKGVEPELWERIKPVHKDKQ